ncbi:MAG: DUF2807 domain-containing protein, partial [Gramella sp.]|nr:DUF2807 domain-containing protein [Christiangramia sp.]
MKTIVLILILLLTYPFNLQAQKKEKVKGDKEVITTSGEITGDFNKLEVSNNLLVEIQTANRNSYVLTTDQNLAEEVEVEVRDGVLRVYTRSKIVKSKKLHLFLNLINIEEISIKDDAVVETSSKLRLDKIDLYLNGSGEIDLDLEINGEATLSMNDNSKGKLKIDARNMVVNMKNRSDLKADIQTEDLQVILSKSADAKLEGKASNVLFNLEGSSNLNAKKLKTQTAVLNSKNRSDIYVDASKTIEIDAEGKSKIYVYGNPDIQIKGFT